MANPPGGVLLSTNPFQDVNDLATKKIQNKIEDIFSMFCREGLFILKALTQTVKGKHLATLKDAERKHREGALTDKLQTFAASSTPDGLTSVKEEMPSKSTQTPELRQDGPNRLTEKEKKTGEGGRGGAVSEPGKTFSRGSMKPRQSERRDCW